MMPASWAVASASPFGSVAEPPRRRRSHADRPRAHGAPTRQRLAADVDHPNVARLVDVGELVHGRER